MKAQAYYSGKNISDYSEILLTKGNRVVDFYGKRKEFKILENINEADEMAKGLFASICYLADLHLQGFYHGDIKP